VVNSRNNLMYQVSEVLSEGEAPTADAVVNPRAEVEVASHRMPPARTRLFNRALPPPTVRSRLQVYKRRCLKESLQSMASSGKEQGNAEGGMGGIPGPFRQKTETVKSPHLFSTSEGHSEIRSLERRSSFNDPKTCHHGGLGRLPGVLFTDFHGPKKIRRIPSRDRPVSTQSHAPANTIQNGNNEFHSTVHPTRRLVHVNGSTRCVFPHIDASRDLEIPSFCMGQQSLSVRQPSLRPLPRSVHFHNVTKQLAILARGRGLRLKMYLDDWLTLNRNEERCREDTHNLVVLTQQLGFNIKPEKSDFIPSTTFSYLGMTFDTTTFTVCPNADRIQSLTVLLDYLRQSRTSSYRTLLSLLGKMESMATLLPLARVFKRPLQREISARIAIRTDYNQQVALGAWFVEVTQKWTDREWLNSSVPIRTMGPTVYLYTDASKTGWGGHTDTSSVSGVWTSQESLFHINLLEMEAVSRCMRKLVSTLRGRHVTVCGDNTTWDMPCLSPQTGRNSVSFTVTQSRTNPHVGSLAEDHDLHRVHSRQAECLSGHAQQETRSFRQNGPSHIRLSSRCGECGANPWWIYSRQDTTRGYYATYLR
jgi:hypothetical protein